MQAIVEDEPVLLHMWLRVFLRAPAAPQPQGMQQQQQQQPSVHAHVKGFATIESLSLAKREDWSFHSEDHTGKIGAAKARSLRRPSSSGLHTQKHVFSCYRAAVQEAQARHIHAVSGHSVCKGSFAVQRHALASSLSMLATTPQPPPPARPLPPSLFTLSL